MLEDYRKLWKENLEELNNSTSSIPKLLANRYTCKDWTEKPVPEEYTKEILNAIQWTPFKAGVPTFKVWVLTDSDKGKEIKNYLYNNVAKIENTTMINKIVTTQPDPQMINPQVLAPLVLAFWTSNYNNYDYDNPQKNIVSKQYYDKFNGHEGDAVAMAAMNAVLTAESLGLKTGFCKCLNKNFKKLEGALDNLELLVGIGYEGQATSIEEDKGNFPNAKTRLDLFDFK